jgi:acetyl esterase/lipase
MKRAYSLLWVLAIASVATAPADSSETGALTSLSYDDRYTPAEITEAAEPLFESFDRPEPRLSVDVYEITFRTRDADGSEIEALASLYVPVTRDSDRFPVLAFGSGTTGIADRCAPSLERPRVIRWGWYRQNMLAYAAQGIITVFPDYVGFNSPDIPQRYFSKAAEGYLMLDALRAARAAWEQYPHEIRTAAEPHEGNVTAGYSQGGHAALAALDMNELYAPELRLDGAIGFGSTNDVEALMREAAYYSPYIVYSYQQIYGDSMVRPDELLEARWADSLEEDVLRMCVDEFQRYYPFEREPMYTDTFYSALMDRQLGEAFPEFKSILDRNLTGLDGHGRPVLMVQGNQDIIVTNDAQREYVGRLRESGSEVELVEMEGVRHRHTRPAGFGKSVEFIFEVTGAR